MKYKLTKSDYCHGQICTKRLWMMHHKSDQAAKSGEYLQWISQQGQHVENLAQKKFPDGIMVERNSNSIHQTKQLIKNKAKTIFQAAFCADDVLVYCDVLDRQSDGSYYLYEIKSFSDLENNVNTNDTENFYTNDLLIQTLILRLNNLQVNRSSILYLNNQYKR